MVVGKKGSGVPGCKEEDRGVTRVKQDTVPSNSCGKKPGTPTLERYRPTPPREARGVVPGPHSGVNQGVCRVSPVDSASPVLSTTPVPVSKLRVNRGRVDPSESTW